MGRKILAQFPWENIFGKWSLGRASWRWEDNIKLSLKEMCCEGGKWMELVQDHIQLWTLILAVLNLRFVL